VVRVEGQQGVVKVEKGEFHGGFYWCFMGFRPQKLPEKLWILKHLRRMLWRKKASQEARCTGGRGGLAALRGFL